MPEVIVDDEPVEFNGPIPEDPKIIFDLLFEALAGERKSVLEYHVDGSDILQLQDQNFPSHYDTIVAKSISHAQLTLRLIESTLEISKNIVSELESYASRILSNPWSIVFEKMQDFIDKVTPLVHLMDGMGPYATNYKPTWADKFEKIQFSNKEAFELVLSGFEKGDVACLSEAIFDKLVPITTESLIFLEDTVKKDLSSQS